MRKIENETILAEALRELAGRDGRIAAALAQVGVPPLRRRPPGFATLLGAIVSQQLSTKAAATIWGRLEARLGTVSPEAVLALDIEEFRAIGMSRAKAAYALGLAQAALEGALDFRRLARRDDEAAIAELVQLKGIGRWSAEMYLLFALRRPDIWPVDDLAVQIGIARILDLAERPGRKALQEIGEAWRPWRSAAARLAWHYYSKAPL